VFNALLAPMIFDRLAEYPLAIFLTCLLGYPARISFSARRDMILPSLVFAIAALLVSNQGGLADSAIGAVALTLAAGLGIYACVSAGTRPTRFALTVGAVLLAGGLAPDPAGTILHRSRNFYGVVKVARDPKGTFHRLIHGNTLHGQQSLAPARRDEPLTYFTRSGPIGQVFPLIGPDEDVSLPSHKLNLGQALSPNQKRVAVVGLGAGTLACYARPAERWTFFELDPEVVRLAETPHFFTFLADARRRGANIDTDLGDARLRIQDAPDHAYSLIVLDAFGSDAVPVHLLSLEAIALYRSKLAQGGCLVFNLTNRYLDLDPVIGRQAAAAGLVCRVRYDVDVSASEREAGKFGSIWAVAAKSATDLGELAVDPRWQPPRTRPNSRAWTDRYSDLASYLVLSSSRFRSRAASTDRSTQHDRSTETEGEPYQSGPPQP
jgi:hypothetical protein